jgi:amidohydrolase
VTAHRLDALVTPHLERLVAIRRDLHAHPELGYEEHRTAELVEETLRELGYAPSRPIETGVIADTGEGEALALRADLDALPLTELTGVEHASTHEGRMHACGHDGHATILLGTAMALATARGRLTGNVRLLFQPAEEGGAGAAKMIEAGVLEGVSRVFGLHNWPKLALDRIAVKPGALMAAASAFHVTIRGKGGHGSQPWNALDPVLPACHFVTQLQGLVARETDHATPAVVSACSIHGGTAINIIPDEVEVSGTVRTFDDAQSARIGEAIARVADAAAAAGGCVARTEYRTYYPVTVNHADEAELVREVGAELFGEEAVTEEGLPMAGAEDFSFYLQQRPGAYFLLGGGVVGAENPPCHSARYDFNDDLILRGVRTWLRLVERSLGCTLA